MIKENRNKICKECGKQFRCRNRREINLRLFCNLKCRGISTSKLLSINRKGIGNPMFGKTGWNKGKKMSEEHCKKLSLAHKGQKGYWKDKTRPKLTSEIREKISESLRNRTYEQIVEWKRKLSESSKGRKVTEKTKQKLRKPKSIEHRKNIALSKIGKNNPNWKGGIYIDYSKSPKYKRWQKSIKKRDSFICQECGSNNNLHAHHIKNKKDFPVLMFNLDNGITLCEKCHRNIHYN